MSAAVNETIFRSRSIRSRNSQEESPDYVYKNALPSPNPYGYNDTNELDLNAYGYGDDAVPEQRVECPRPRRRGSVTKYSLDAQQEVIQKELQELNMSYCDENQKHDLQHNVNQKHYCNSDVSAGLTSQEKQRDKSAATRDKSFSKNRTSAKDRKKSRISKIKEKKLKEQGDEKPESDITAPSVDVVSLPFGYGNVADDLSKYDFNPSVDAIGLPVEASSISPLGCVFSNSTAQLTNSDGYPGHGVDGYPKQFFGNENCSVANIPHRFGDSHERSLSHCSIAKYSLGTSDQEFEKYHAYHRQQEQGDDYDGDMNMSMISMSDDENSIDSDENNKSKRGGRFRRIFHC